VLFFGIESPATVGNRHNEATYLFLRHTIA